MPVRKRQFGVYIGRFQPLHLAHLGVMEEALDHVEKLIVVLGSANAARSIRNPWHEEEREHMVRAALQESGVPAHRVLISSVRDHYYNEDLWLAEVQQAVTTHTRGSTDVMLIGDFKDDTSTYLGSFPGFHPLPTRVRLEVSASDLRQAYFQGDLDVVRRGVADAVFTQLQAFSHTSSYAELREEWTDIQAYQASWAHSPFPPTFNTTDAVVVRSGHVLAIRRGVNPGKGKLALPGGFLDARTPLLASAIRELQEETGLGPMFNARDWGSYLTGKETFDHPGRSLRGRTITTAFHFHLGTGELPPVSGRDDARDAMWVPLSVALGSPREWFEDHHSILEAFLLAPSLDGPSAPHVTHLH